MATKELPAVHTFVESENKGAIAQLHKLQEVNYDFGMNSHSNKLFQKELLLHLKINYIINRIKMVKISNIRTEWQNKAPSQILRMQLLIG